MPSRKQQPKGNTNKHPSDSAAQQSAEHVLLGWMANQLGESLAPLRFEFPDGSYVEIDGATPSGDVLCEAWAHQGRPKGAQSHKVMSDALKLLAVAEAMPTRPHRLILLLADTEAAQPFLERSWRATALSRLGVEVLVGELPPDVSAEIKSAQKAQHR